MEPMADASSIERALLNRAAMQRAPINGSIELLPLCNMNCDMCYVRLTRAEMEAQGRLRTAEEWLELGRQMQKQGVLFLLLTGGEPLLFPEFKQVYLGLRKMGMILTLNTNGTLIDEAWADFFAQYPPRRINITLYGASAVDYDRLCHYPEGFARVTRAAELLRERKVDVKIGVSMTPANVGGHAKIHDISEALGTPAHVDTYMMPAARERSLPFDKQNRLSPVEAAQARMYALRRGLGEEWFAHFAREKIAQIDHGAPREAVPGHMTCLAGSCSFTINWQGKMRPCVVMSAPEADVFEVSFAEAWRRIRAAVDEIATCATCTACRLKPLCRTCAAAALLETGSYDGVPNYLCQYAEESLRLLQEYIAEHPTSED